MENLVTRKLIHSMIASFLTSILISVFALSVLILNIFQIFPHLISVFIQWMAIFVYPVSPIVYGWLTKDKVGSIIVGSIPILGLFLAIYSKLLIAGDGLRTELIVASFYFGILIIIGGVEGYFASKRKKEYFVITIALAILWLWTFINMVSLRL